MKKVLFSLLLLVSVNAFAADVELSVGASKNRVSDVRGSIVRLNVQDEKIGYGLQTETAANSTRNQIDGAYTLLDAAGFSASVGLGGVSETGVKSHMVYLGRAQYAHDFNPKWRGVAGVEYRNDFEKTILDRQTSAKLGLGYAFTAKSAIDASYSRTYGDSKRNIYVLAYNTKF